MSKVLHWFPEIWDSTQLEAFSCPMRGFRQYIQHFQQEESVHLVAGAAFAKGLHVAREAFYDGGESEEDSIYAGILALRAEYGDYYDQWNENKSVDRMALALEAYFAEYRLPFDDVVPYALPEGGHAYEMGMLEPIVDMQGKEMLHPVTGKPLLFSGRMDMLGQHMGKLWVTDEKTTSGYFSKDWGSQWDLRGQFSAYCWLLQQKARNYGSQFDYLKDISGVIVRGISLPKSTAKDFAKRQQAYMDSGTIRFQQHITSRSHYEIENWHRFMVERVQSAKFAYQSYCDSGETLPEMFFSGTFGSDCTSYSKPCQFMASCKSRNGEGFLSTEYPQSIWKPAEARRVPLHEYLEEIGQL
jgi:hypothetical protein